ncbi:MAG: NAD(P)H-dependent oxidoreductase [Clostridia bacterium]|nr:NAD(P)H-dependent oxidoreductase [Clostridia bacterium]
MERPILFINACARRDSRTRRLADKLLLRLGGPVEEVRLDEVSFPVADGGFLDSRDRLISQGDFSAPAFDLARQFSGAETVVIAAPYWDLSFPAALKQYFEQINVVGVTFKYTEEGVPVGLCRAGRLFYVTTAGGCYAPEEYGFGYVRALAQGYYGIQDVRLIKAVGLDLYGADVDAILASAEKSISEMDLD